MPIQQNKTKPGDCKIIINYNNKSLKRSHSSTKSSSERDSRRHKGDLNKMQTLSLHKGDCDNVPHLSSLFNPEIGSLILDKTELVTLDFDIEACCRDLIKKCEG